MNQNLLLILIGAVVLAIVGVPLLRGRGARSPRAGARPAVPRGGTGHDAPDTPDEQDELALDLAMGRLSESDYAALRARAAATVEPSGPAPEPRPSPSRPTPTGDLDKVAERMIAAYRDGERPRCPDCGERPESHARFCSSCGLQLGAAASGS